MRPSARVVPLLLLALAAAPAAAAPPRTFSLDYTAATVTIVQQADGRTPYGARCGAGCVEFTTARKGERTITITLTDASGQAVGWVASLDRAVRATGCGRGVVRSRPGETWYVAPAAVTSCTGLPTRGRLEVRLSG